MKKIIELVDKIKKIKIGKIIFLIYIIITIQNLVVKVGNSYKRENNIYNEIIVRNINK